MSFPVCSDPELEAEENNPEPEQQYGISRRTFLRSAGFLSAAATAASPATVLAQASHPETARPIN
jgi:hypothetical protein